MRRPEIVIKTDGIVNTEVFINGEKLDGVISVRFFHSYQRNSGIPSLQIDLDATNVRLDTKMLPALPEPFRSHYLPIGALMEFIPKEMVEKLCRDQGIDLEIT